LHGLLRDPKRRGLADPLLVVTDGAPGLIRAVESLLPAAPAPALPRASDPESAPDIAIRARACCEAASPALATVLRGDFVQVYERDLPART